MNTTTTTIYPLAWFLPLSSLQRMFAHLLVAKQAAAATGDDIFKLRNEGLATILILRVIRGQMI